MALPRIGRSYPSAASRADSAPYTPGGGGENPSWLPAVGEWGTVPNSNFTTAGVLHSGADTVWSKWCGAILTPVGVYNGATFIPGPAMVLWGGGHNDYGGNELYALAGLDSASPVCLRLRDATSPAPSNVNFDGSGNPVSRHTYNSIVCPYNGSRNRLLSIGGYARHADSDQINVVHWADLNTASPNTNNPWASGASLGGGAVIAAYEPASDRVWFNFVGQNQVGFYDVAANTVTSENFKSPSLGSNHATAVDDTRGIWATTWVGGLRFYRTNNGTGNDYYTPTTTGSAPAGGSSHGMVWDSVDDRFVVWADGGKTLYFLTPPASNPYEGGNAWTWSSVTPSGGSTPSAGQANGTYGRFALVTFSGGARGYLLSNAQNESAYFYRRA